MARKSAKDKLHDTEILVSEFASDHQGSLSPFGDVGFPQPATRVDYEHPSEQDRPHVPSMPAAAESGH